MSRTMTTTIFRVNLSMARDCGRRRQVKTSELGDVYAYLETETNDLFLRDIIKP